MKTEEIMKKQKEYVMPCTPAARQPIVMHEGRGAIVRDVEGREYIDCFGGYSVVNIGHCHPKVVKAIQEQAAMLYHSSYDYYNVPQTLLAERLAQVAPAGLKKSFFCNSGAEAIEGSVKLAKKYAAKHGRLGSDIISLDCSFHGRTALTVALSGQRKYKKNLGGFVDFPGINFAPAPYCFRCALRLKYPECGVYCAQSIEGIVDMRTTGDLAAFVAEPILGEGGIIAPPDEYFKIAVKIIKEHDGLFIADEVQSGFARTGKMFAVEHYGVTPDIMAMAKGIASGIPIAAFIATEEVANAFEPGDHSSTYGGNALTCAAALANLEVITGERLAEKAAKTGKLFMDGLRDLAKKYRLIGEVRGKGLMVGVEMVKDLTTKTPAVDEARRVRETAREMGVIIGVGGVYRNVLRLQPPLVITGEQIKKVLSALDSGFKAAS